MNRLPTHAPSDSGLSRRSVGLTDAHKELIRMLAGIAVEDYLREIEVGDEPAENREEAAL